MLDQNRFAQIIATGRLPSPQGVGLRIMELIQNESVTLEELGHAIKADPALTSQLLKLANTLRFGSRVPVSTVESATALVGLSSLKSVALSLSLVSHYRHGLCRNFDYDRFWAMSLARAVALQHTLVRLPLLMPEDGFSLGLLSRLGRLAMATVFPEEYSRMLGYLAEDPKNSLAQMEKQDFFITSDELTQAMFANWGLPQTFVAALTPTPLTLLTQQEVGLPHAVLFAEEVASWMIRQERDHPSITLVAWGHAMTFSSEELPVFCQEVLVAWREWADMLKLPQELAHTSPLQSFHTQTSTHIQSEQSTLQKELPLKILMYARQSKRADELASILARQGHFLRHTDVGKEMLPMAMNDLPQIALIEWAAPRAEEMISLLHSPLALQGLYIVALGGESEMKNGTQWLQNIQAQADAGVLAPWHDGINSVLLAARRNISWRESKTREMESTQRMMTELSLAHWHVRQSSLVDQMCGYPNKRYAVRRLKALWAQAASGESRLLLLMVRLPEVDSFATLYGDEAWQEAFRQCGAVIEKELREFDELCVIEGHGFLVVCPDADSTLEENLTERLYEVMSDFHVEMNELQLALRASIKTWSFTPQIGESCPEDLLDDFAILGNATHLN